MRQEKGIRYDEWWNDDRHGLGLVADRGRFDPRRGCADQIHPLGQKQAAVIDV